MFYTIGAIVRRRLDRHGVVTLWRSARLYARGRRFCDWHGLLRAGAKHRFADRSAGSTKTGLRCAGSDCRLELRPSSRPAGKRAQDRQVDPVYFDTSYYLYPDGPIAVEALRVIGAAMAEACVVGIGRLALSRRERIVLL